MPELKPLPCPYCGTEEIEVWDGPANFMECQYCHMTGPHAPSESSAIGLWNSLPRVLTWTTEPKLGEWNWWRSGGYRLLRYVYTDGTIDTTMMGRIPWQDVGGEWAGPIQAPGEFGHE